MKKFVQLAGLASVGAAVILSAPASAAVVVVGNSAARQCYEAAEAGLSSDQSLQHCNKALNEEALSPEDAVATYVNRGIVRFFRGEHDAALRDLDTAIAKDPQEPEAYLNKGIVLLRQQQRVGDAVPLFSTALSMQTKKPALAHLGRGMAYELSGNVNAAYRDYRQANQIDPEWRAPVAELSRFTVVRN